MLLSKIKKIDDFDEKVAEIGLKRGTRHGMIHGMRHGMRPG